MLECSEPFLRILWTLSEPMHPEDVVFLQQRVIDPAVENLNARRAIALS